MSMSSSIVYVSYSGQSASRGSSGSVGEEGDGVDGAGVEGAGVEGAGVEGAGVEGAGVEGAGVDDVAEEEEVLPQPAREKVDSKRKTPRILFFFIILSFRMFSPSGASDDEKAKPSLSRFYSQKISEKRRFCFLCVPMGTQGVSTFTSRQALAETSIGKVEGTMQTKDEKKS